MSSGIPQKLALCENPSAAVRKRFMWVSGSLAHYQTLGTSANNTGQETMASDSSSQGESQVFFETLAEDSPQRSESTVPFSEWGSKLGSSCKIQTSGKDL
jgi:hypothetical protein